MVCVVIAASPTIGAAEERLREAVQDLARTLRAVGRASDAIGRLGQTEFAIVAPDTDSEGAVRLVDRITAAVREQLADRGGPPFELRAGYEAIANPREAPGEASDLMRRVSIALRSPGRRQPGQPHPGGPNRLFGTE